MENWNNILTVFVLAERLQTELNPHVLYSLLFRYVLMTEGHKRESTLQTVLRQQWK